MMKTSPIETTADNFGSRILIVATNAEKTAKRIHWNEKLPPARRHRNAEGIAAAYSPSK
jgi:hypothetical protein